MPLKAYRISSKPSALGDRFMDNVLRIESCWEWVGPKSKGYGRFRAICEDGVQRYLLAHRYAYECTKGPVPLDLNLDHLCKNKACCNPDHLEPVTHGENVRRSKHRFECKRGHATTENNTYWAIDTEGFKYKACRVCKNLNSMLRKRAMRAKSRGGIYGQNAIS